MSFLKRKKIQKKKVLEKLCNKIADVIRETFTRNITSLKYLNQKRAHILDGAKEEGKAD